MIQTKNVKMEIANNRVKNAEMVLDVIKMENASVPLEQEETL